MRLLVFFLAVLQCACQPRKAANAEVKLEHGLEDKFGTKFPAVWGISKGIPSKLDSGTQYGAPMCTGTAVSKTVILTAAHCLLGDPPDQKYWLVNHGLLALVDGSSQVIEGVALSNSKARGVVGTAFDSSQGFVADTALIRFATADFRETQTLFDEPIKKGQKVEMIGFGYDSKQKIMTRQYGRNKVHEVIDGNSKDPSGDKIFDFYQGMIWIQLDRNLNDRPGVSTGTVPGDSGGPLLINGKLAGVLYGGAYWEKNAKPEYQEQFNDSIYVNLKHKSNVEFFDSARTQGWDVPSL